MFLSRWRVCRRIPKKLDAIRCTSRLSHDPSKFRNMALVAHIDSGKTTLTESILLTSSYLSSPGSVDTGSTTTDFLPVERERGITVQSASIPVRWKEWTFNLIDTPGHADFGMEVESASRVIDGAVVLVDSVEGVEAQTKGVWKQLDRYGVPTRMIFLNKLDRPGASFHSSLLSLLAHRMHPRPMSLTIPVASFEKQDYVTGEPGIQGLVDLVKWNVWKWDNGGQVTCHALPQSVDDLQHFELFSNDHPLVAHLPVARTQLLDNLSMLSEELMEHLLELPSTPSAYLGVKGDVIVQHLRNLTLRGEILPILCGSAMKNIGTELVMDYIGELLPSPIDVVHDPQGRNPPVRLLAWKVSWDPRRGWMTFVRVYSGKLTRQSILLNSNRNQREKVSKLLLLYASEAREVEELAFGSVGVILGLKFTRTGDTLISLGGKVESPAMLRDITPPPAVISTSMIPQSHADLEPVQAALDALTRTDPSVRVDTQEGQILVHGLGTLHLEIVESKLRDEWNINFEFGRRRVSYREGLGPRLSKVGWNKWESNVGGKEVSVTIPIEIRPLEADEKGDPVWDGNLVVNPSGKSLPAPETLSGTSLSYIAEGISAALSSSPHSTLAMSRVAVKLKDFHNLEHVPPPTLTTATAETLRKWIRNAGLGPIMEPYIYLKISVHERNFGKIIKDLTEHGGEVLDLAADSTTGFDGSEASGFSEDGVYIPPAWLSPSGRNDLMTSQSQSPVRHAVHALAPLSQFFDYSNRLRALSEGHGTFEMTTAGFREVSDDRRTEIMKEIGRA